MTKIETVLLTGKTHTTPSGHNGRVNLELTAPRNARAQKHAFSDIETHPTAEQLFAGAWSACFSGAIELAAKDRAVTLPADLSVDIEVDLGKTGAEFFLQARVAVSLPGLPHDLAEALVEAAHGICPYSKAVHGNIDVVTTVL